MFGTNDSTFKKYRLWRARGSTVSPKSQLGLEIKDNNMSTRTVSSHEVETVIKKNKAYNALYFWPISNILEYMARNGKINGVYMNWKQGWKFNSVTHDEIKTKNKLEWKVRHEKYEDFINDLVQIRNYRLHYINKNTDKEEAITIINDMLKEEWTMNTLDGNVTRKQLWHQYRSDTIKIMNLEFRLKDNAISRGITEVPLVINEDNGKYFLEMYNAAKLQAIEERWNVVESATTIPSRKKKKSNTKSKIKMKQMRAGTEEMMDELKEIRNLIIAMNKREDTEGSTITLDKFDQIRQVERSIHDEDTKEIMVQIILSRQDNDNLQYKVLEEKLLSGKDYLVHMPRIEKLRTNLLGMVQEINECAPGKWEDRNLIERLQIITGQRIKKKIEYELSKITEILVQFRKETEIINEIKSECETKEKFDIIKLKDELRKMIEEKEYENVQYEFLERWCEEIERNVTKGFAKGDSTNEKNKTKMKMLKPSTSKITNKRGRFTISSDSEDSFEKVQISKMKRTKLNISEIVISSDSNDNANTSNNSEVIGRDNYTYVVYSSEEE